MSNDRASNKHHKHLVLQQVNTDRNRRLANWIISSLLERANLQPYTIYYNRRGPSAWKHKNSLKAPVLVNNQTHRIYIHIHTYHPQAIWWEMLLHEVCKSHICIRMCLTTCVNATQGARQIKCPLAECTLHALLCICGNTHAKTATITVPVQSFQTLLHHMERTARSVASGSQRS